MVQLDGVDYTIKTPQENTDDIISYINTYCTENGVKNAYGEDVYIEPNDANPLYALARGVGYVSSILQKLAYSAGCSMSIPASSSSQLLNLATLAGVSRAAATKTTITCTAFAESDQSCVISTEMTATLTIAGEDVIFQPAFDLALEPGESKQLILTCQQYGSFNISAGTITGFDAPVAGLRKLATFDSTPGQTEEPLSHLRERLQRRAVSDTRLDRAAAAIQALPGVSVCSIYFNYDPALTKTVNIGAYAVQVPPRMALLMVLGYNEDIAATFYNYLLCQTVNPTDIPGVITQNYVTKANQTIPVYAVPPYQQAIYVRVFYNENLTTQQQQAIADTVCMLAGEVSVGSDVTSAMVISLLKETYPDLDIQGAEVSLDNSTFDYKVQAPITAVPIFNTNNITVEGLV